jgi:outer membrane protein assembly factor BamB
MQTLFLRAFSWAALLAVAATVVATETEHLGLQVLPAPGKVVVDGKSDDWDLTAGILVCGDVESARDKVSVWFYAMYGAHNLYLLARWNDPEPLNNPGATAGDFGFQGDCLQVRVITAPEQPAERTTHLTCWRGRDGKDVIDAVYGRQFNEGNVRDLKSAGAEQGFTVYDNKRGYTQELSIPWSALAKGNDVPKAGDSLRMAVEPNFTIGTNGRLSYKDIFQANMTLDRVFTFMSANQWGTATLEKKGNLSPRPVRLADGREFKVKFEAGLPVVDWTGLIRSRELTGFKPIRLAMPEDGYASLIIRDSTGAVVRNLLSCEFLTKGSHDLKWDGLTTPNERKPGEPVAPGKFTWSAIYHTGIGLRLKGWAANSGETPWDFPAGTGNWGGDHGLPATIATDAERVYLGWTAAEAGKALIACDLDGKVQWNNTHGGIGGASAIAVDDVTVYALNGVSIYRVDKKNGIYTPWQGTDSTDLAMSEVFEKFAESPEHHIVLAAGRGKLYVSSKQHDQVAVLDAGTGKVERRLSVKSPRYVHLASSGKLYVVAGGDAVIAFEPNADQPRPVLAGLQNATSVAVGSDGRLFVGTRDPDNQVKIFSANGKAQAAIGRAGGRALEGPWTADGMRFVSAVGLDAAGKLWVVEEDGSPKRVSVWDVASGKLIREFFGPTSYGAMGGAIDPHDPSIMVGQGCEWRLDPKTGRATCLGTITRGGMEVSRFGTGPDSRVYLAIAANWAFNVGPLQIFERVGDADYKPRTTLFYADEEGKELPASGHGQPSKAQKTMVWSDENGDGQRQSHEVTGAPGELRFSGWYMGLTPDLTLYSGDKQFKVTGFTPCGAPKYDLAHPTQMPAAGLGSADGRLVLESGEYGVDHGWLRGLDIASGKLLWRYPDTYVGVHGSHNAPPAEVGLIRGSFPPCGTAKLPQPIGSIWVIPTNVGEWHVLTEDGYYLTRLFEGDPLRVRWPEQAVPGVSLDNAPPGMGGEDFGGSITLAADGKLYLQAGKTAYWNIEVVGLETVKQLTGGEVEVAAGEEKLAAALREEYLQDRTARQQLVVPKLSPKFTGNIEQDFKGAALVKFQKQPDAPIRSAAAWDDQNMYLAWEVQDKTPWVNGAAEREMMYLGGDTVDFQLATDPQADANRGEAVAGDFRLSIGNFQGKPQAVLYRKVAKQQHPRTFSSGVVKEYRMESVVPLDGVTIEARVSPGEKYTVEAAVPLALVDLKPAEGLQLRGDFGATHGDPAGARTRLRSYWTNQHTGIVDDAVFELQMEPKNWGRLLFKQ